MKRAALGLFLGLLPSVAFAQAPPSMPPVVATAAGSSGAVVATMAAKSTATNYLCSLDISAAGSATISPITVAGLLGGSLVIQGISAGGAPFSHSYSPCIPASAPNTAITVTTTADGSATAVNITATGFFSY